MQKRKRIIYIITAAALSMAAGGFFYLTKKTDYLNTYSVPYKTFYEAAKNGAISAAELSEDKITFTYKSGGPEDTKRFFTENPASPQLKEFLLLNDVAVTEKKDAGEIVPLIFDALFYAVFFVLIFTVFKKFVSPNTFRIARKTGVTFDDVIGMDALKKDMMQIIEGMKHPAEYRKQGIRMPKGILLEGAPGNGKTLFARAFAGEAQIPFIPAKATDFESMFMAIGPAKVKLLFRKARKCAPCIVFIDEFDGIGTKRNYSGSAIETENTRIVTALLNELDGFTQNNGILVLAATNSRAALDEALIRPGRFDAKYTVPYPDIQAREKLIERCSGNKSAASDCTAQILARSFNGFSCAQIESVINRAALVARQNGRESYTLADIQTALREL